MPEELPALIPEVPVLLADKSWRRVDLWAWSDEMELLREEMLWLVWEDSE